MGKPGNLLRNFHQANNNEVEYRRNKYYKLDSGDAGIKYISKSFQLPVGIAPGDKSRGGGHQHYYRRFNYHGKGPCYTKGRKIVFCIIQPCDKGNQDWLLKGHHQPGKRQRPPEKKYPPVCQPFS